MVSMRPACACVRLGRLATVFALLLATLSGVAVSLGIAAPPVGAAPVVASYWRRSHLAAFGFTTSQRWMRAATQLKGGSWAGRALVCGGAEANTVGMFNLAYSDCYVYDPPSDSWWKVEGTPPPPVVAHTLDATNDGRAVIFGGAIDGNHSPTSDTWVFSPGKFDPYGPGGVTGTWVKKNPANRPGARLGAGHSPLSNGKIVVYGGTNGTVLGANIRASCNLPTCNGDWLYTDTWIYDPTAGVEGAWTQVSTTGPARRVMSMMAPTEDGRAVMFGGTAFKGWVGLQWVGHYHSNETWLFNPSNNSWTQATVQGSPLPMSHGGFSSLGGGRFVQAGGISSLPIVNCYHCASTQVLTLSGNTATWERSIDASSVGWTGMDYITSVSIGTGRAMLLSVDIGTWVFSDIPVRTATTPAKSCATQVRPSSDTFDKWECMYDLSNPPGAFGTAGGNAGNPEAHLVDVYIPKVSNKSELPVTFMVHGGGLVGGTKEDLDPVAVRYARAGFVVFNVNYTVRNNCAIPEPSTCNRIDMSSGDGDSFPEDMQGLRDIATAFRWMWDNYVNRASSPVGAKSRVVLLGHSAGAMLTQLLANDPKWLAEAYGNPPNFRADALVAGHVAMDMTPSFNTSDPSQGWPLEQVNLSGRDSWFAGALANIADLQSADSDGVRVWQSLSATWQSQRLNAVGRQERVPQLYVSGGAGSSGDDPVGLQKAARDFTLYQQMTGVPSSYIQPLISRVNPDGKRCWSSVGHNSPQMLVMSNREFGDPARRLPDTPGATTFDTDLSYFAEAGVCNGTDMASAPVVLGTNGVFDRTLLGFGAAVRIGAQPASVSWSPPVAGDVLPAFSGLSIPDDGTFASSLKLNLGGGIVDDGKPDIADWNQARVVTDTNREPAYQNGGQFEATLSGARVWLEANPTVSAALQSINIPTDLFRHQAEAADGTSFSLRAPLGSALNNKNYRLIVYFADRSSRNVTVMAEGAIFANVASGGATNVPAVRRDLGTVTVTDGYLDVTFRAATPGAGVRVAGVELLPA